MNGNDERNETFVDIVHRYSPKTAIALGPYSDFHWMSDPKHFLFYLSRYKFCSKMLQGADEVLEVGCGEAFVSAMMLQTVDKLFGIDIVPEIIEYNRNHYRHEGRADYLCHDIISAPLGRKFNAAISLDVIEHIDPQDEASFLGNLADSLHPFASCIIGTPNVTSAPYASSGSKKEHINLHSHESFRASLSAHFHNVFLFSMNDEVVHTGFYPMAHYLIALAVNPR